MMRKSIFRCLSLALAGLILPAAAALAAELVYRDPDAMARSLQHVDVHSAEWLEQIEQGMQQRSESPWPHVQFGYAESLAGRASSAQESYRIALGLAADPISERHVRWSHGWSLFNLGDYRAALGEWSRAAELHGGHPFWVPYTRALAHWELGEAEKALRWYDIATRSFPERWARAEGVARMTAGWKPRERQAVDTLFLRWRSLNLPE